MEEERGGEPLQSRESVTPGARGPCESSPSCPREWDHPLLEAQLEVDQEEMALCGIQGQSWQCFSRHGRLCPPCLLAATWAGRGTGDRSPELCLLLLLQPPPSQSYGAPFCLY